MSTFYYLNVSAHVLAALLWLGGMFFLAAVGAPVLRRVDSPELRAALFRKLGEQFRWVGWVSIAVLLLTGIGNLHFRGLLRWRVLGDPGFWGTAYGGWLGWKLALVGAMLANQALHDFWIGPGASRRDPGSPEALRFRRLSSWLARVNALVGVVLVYVAVRLARGG